MLAETCRRWLFVAALLGAPLGAHAQMGQSGPPAVTVAPVTLTPVTPSTDYIGRIMATDRVNLVARVAAFLEIRSFKEGAEVKKGDPLYRLEQGPFQADVEAREAVVDQYQAQLENAELTLARAKMLLNTPAGQQSTVDSALANQLSIKAQRMSAEAQLAQSRINLGYTDIRAPIDGKIGRTAVTIGNYVTPGTGVLATIVSQDPMYVVFPVATRAAMALRDEAVEKGGIGALVVKVRLPNGRIYNQTGKLDFLDNSVAGGTDTIILRAVIPNPIVAKGSDDTPARQLVDGELITAIVEEARPVMALGVPRAAVLTDQGGDYVFVVDDDNKAAQRRVTLANSSPAPQLAVVTNGLKEGEKVVVEGMQRVRPGQPVAPQPVAAEPGPTASQAETK
ncbi:MAG: efflux RND transporter periplasmic adaptor subunit [Hyphomicrobiales bacterium]|nr:efflux RND transporter periplasmic adaptor subunit [Hyphomicrobiales bacterium]